LKVLKLSDDEIVECVKSGKVTFSVYGLGGVGLVLCAAWLRAGARVVGVDVNEGRVRELLSGNINHPERDVREVLLRGLRDGNFNVTSDGVRASRDSDVKVVIVPLTIRNGVPDFNALDNAISSVGRGLSEGDVVIIETSVPPGTTEGRVKTLLEGLSGLRAGEDFGLIYSPERVMIGRALRDLEENYPKIVSGVGAESVRVGKTLYSVICRRGVITVSSPRVAEFEKLAEGIYRDVNIALANELAKLARVLGIDFNEVVAVANTQPYSHIHRAGAGVGGLCIPVYPELMAWVAGNLGLDMKLIKTARSLNKLQPSFIAHLAYEGIRKIGRDVNNSSVALLGLAFRGDIDDSRNSPTYDIIRELRRLGFNDIVVHDPLITSDPVLEDLGIKLCNDIYRVLRYRDAVILVTDHSAYKSLTTKDIYEASGKDAVVIIDGRDVLKIEPARGKTLYTGVGRPWITC